jgi:hypothetical protein
VTAAEMVKDSAAEMVGDSEAEVVKMVGQPKYF